MPKSKQTIITPQGRQRMKKELKIWQNKLASIDKVKADVAEKCGDTWHDNATFEEVERQQRMYAYEILKITNELREAKLLTEKQLETNAQKNKICIGSKIRIKYTNGRIALMKIAGSGDSEPDRGVVAYDTPMGMALLNKKPGQKTELTTNTRKVTIEILNLIH